MFKAEVQDYAIFMMDPRGYITSWTPAAEKIKGYTEAGAVGGHFSVFYTAEDIRRGHPKKSFGRLPCTANTRKKDCAFARTDRDSVPSSRLARSAAPMVDVADFPGS